MDAAKIHARACSTPRPSPCRYDVKWLEVCADNCTKFQEQNIGSKPLIIMYKMGLEVARMDKGANGNELARLVAQHCGEKKAA